MKNINMKFMFDYALKVLGEYASAEKIHSVLGLSRSYVYTVAKNENVKKKRRYGRNEYDVSSFF